MIPKRIIQTAKTRALGSTARAAATNLKLLHPDWDYMFFDDDAVNKFMAVEFPQYRSLFESFPYKIQRFDFFRYLAVFRYGGFYFDLDVFLWKDLSPLLSSGAVFPFEELTLNQHLRNGLGMDWEIGNYAFGSEADHPFLGEVITNCVKAQNDRSWVSCMMRGIPGPFRPDFEVLNTTGPGLISRTLAESESNGESVTVLFPSDVRDPDTWHHFGEYGVHIMEGSWRSKGGFLRRKLASLWEVRARKVTYALSDQLGPHRALPKADANRAALGNLARVVPAH